MDFTVDVIRSPEEAGPVRVLFKEYAASLGIDLGFQHFQEELDHLPGHYCPPSCMLLLARAGREAAGCAALHRLSSDTGELKRLYVRDICRHMGLGDLLIRTVLGRAVKMHYRYVRLDTLPSMGAAQKMYEKMGFYDIDPYVYNPVPGTRYMEMDLHRTAADV